MRRHGFAAASKCGGDRNWTTGPPMKATLSHAAGLDSNSTYAFCEEAERHGRQTGSDPGHLVRENGRKGPLCEGPKSP